MGDNLNANDTEDLTETPVSWPTRIGGVLILLGTGLSMILQNEMAEVAMGAALLGLVLVLGWRKTSAKDVS